MPNDCICIERVLCVATNQVPEETIHALLHDDGSSELPAAMRWEHGFQVWVDEDYQEPHTELAALLRYAKAKGCQWVRLDCDGDLLPESAGLPSFEW